MYEWDQQVKGFISPSVAEEEEVRAAIIAGCLWYDALGVEPEELPHFSGGTFAAPQNQLAIDLVAVVMEGITATGIPRHQLCTLIVRSAQYVYSNGGDPDGWEAFKLITPHAKRIAAGEPSPLPPEDPPPA